MNYEKEMQIYLFGNSGFLGSHLYNKLTKNNTTVILYPANLDQLEKIVPKKTGKLKRNIFVSMAWTSNNSKNYQKDNSNFKFVEQHINLAEFCKRNNYELLIPVLIPNLQQELRLSEMHPLNFDLELNYQSIHSINEIVRILNNFKNSL